MVMSIDSMMPIPEYQVVESTRSAMQFIWLRSVDDAIEAGLGAAGSPEREQPFLLV